MKSFLVVVSVVALAAGCINIPKTINVNLNGSGGSDDDRSDPAPQQRDTSQQDQAEDSALEMAPAAQEPPAPKAASSGDWKDTAVKVAGEIFLATENSVLFYAFDTLAYPNTPVDLVVKLQTVRRAKGISGVEVGFGDGDKLLGTAETDDSGVAKLTWTPPTEGDYKLQARIRKASGDASADLLRTAPAPLLVSARAKGTRFVVIDLDHTVVDSSFFRVLVGGAKPMADSVAVTNRIAKKYSLIYLTHRPDLLTRKSKQWLREHGYPSGPLLVSELRESLGDSGKFKTARLKDVRKLYSNVAIGIGDKYSDAQAYVDNGLTAYLIPHYKQKPKDMLKTAKQVRRLEGKGRLNVVSGWKQIEQGIFGSKKFAPKVFAGNLEKSARKLASEQQRRRDDDDDDDDDDD